MPLPIAGEAASLPAILLDANNYAFLKTIGRSLDGVPVLDEAGLVN